MRYSHLVALSGCTLLAATAAAFSFNRTSSAQTTAAPSVNLREISDEEKLKRFADANVTPAAVLSLKQRTTEAALKALLSRYSLRPYRVFMYASGMHGMHQVGPGDARLDVLDEARAVSFRQITSSDRVTKAAMSGWHKNFKAGPMTPSDRLPPNFSRLMIKTLRCAEFSKLVSPSSMRWRSWEIRLI